MRIPRLLFAFSAVALFLGLCFHASLGAPSIKRQMEIIEATIEGGDPQTIDPAFCYDTESGELLMNVYDTLISFEGEHMDRYLPQLATEWNLVEHDPPLHDPDTGLDWYYTYYFKIRSGVRFHDLALPELTPDDVEYVFERGMVLDMDGGPQWMFYEPLLNGAYHDYINGTTYDIENNVTDEILVGRMIDHAIESNSTHVWFNIAFPGAYVPFMQILSQPWSSIYSKKWALGIGRPTVWPGIWGTYDGWSEYCNPAVPPLDDPTPIVMGTGPFVLANLDRALRYWDANRFENYWRGWGNGPAPDYGISWPAFAGGSQPAGYINHFVVTWAYDWGTASTKFLNGDLDLCAVPRQYIDSMLDQPGIRCIYPLPSLSCNGLFFNCDIKPTTPYGTIYDYGQLNESGIPRDFFGNSSWGMHTRKAFAYCIDYDSWLSENYGDEVQRPATAIIPGVPYYDPTVHGYDINLTRAEEEFKKVPSLWNTGFTINLAYLVWCSSNNSIKWSLFNLIKQSVESLNTKFHVTVTEVPWCYLCCEPGPENFPVSIFSWVADYPDPHNLAYAFYYSKGNYASRMRYSNPTMDALVTAGIAIPDGPQRSQIYHDLQQFAIDDCPSVTLYQSLGRHFERDWICGWYYNPIYMGVYAANLWKWYYTPHAERDTYENDTSNPLPYDVNYDGVVNIIDIASIGQAFGSSFGPPLNSRWSFRADINNDRSVNIVDITTAAVCFGKKSAVWVPS